MKIPSRQLALCLCVVFCSPLQAASHKKHHRAPPPPPGAEPAPTVDPAALPSVSLEPFLDAHLGRILAPLTDQGLDQPELVAILKAAYADGLAAASAARKPAYQAAENVCDAMAGAMTERQTALAALHGATATHSSEIRQPRGGRHEGRAVAKGEDSFFVGNEKSRWVQHAAALRQNITALYLREREIERQVANIAAPTPAPAASAPMAGATPVAAIAADPAATPSAGPMVAAAPAPTPGFSLSPVGTWHWHAGPENTFTDGGSVNQHGHTQGRWHWTDQSKGELEIRWNHRRYADELTLQSDGQYMSGRSSNGTTFTEKKIH